MVMVGRCIGTGHPSPAVEPVVDEVMRIEPPSPFGKGVEGDATGKGPRAAAGKAVEEDVLYPAGGGEAADEATVAVLRLADEERKV